MSSAPLGLLSSSTLLIHQLLLGVAETIFFFVWHVGLCMAHSYGQGNFRPEAADLAAFLGMVQWTQLVGFSFSTLISGDSSSSMTRQWRADFRLSARRRFQLSRLKSPCA